MLFIIPAAVAADNAVVAVAHVQYGLAQLAAAAVVAAVAVAAAPVAEQPNRKKILFISPLSSIIVSLRSDTYYLLSYIKQ